MADFLRQNLLKLNGEQIKLIRQQVFPQGLQLNWEKIYDLQFELDEKLKKLKEIPEQEIRNDIILVTDYDYTVLLQQDNVNSEKNLCTPELFAQINQLWDSSDKNINQFGDLLIQNRDQARIKLNRDITESQQSQIIETQYCILTYFIKMVEIMTKNKFRKMHLVSNSSFYLIFFGMYITSDAIQMLRNQTVIENPIVTMKKLGYLEIQSTNHVKNVVRKQFAFQRIVESNPEIQHFISIGDGEDEERSSIMIREKFPQVQVHIVQFDLQVPNKCALNIILSYHDEALDLLTQIDFPHQITLQDVDTYIKSSKMEQEILRDSILSF